VQGAHYYLLRHGDRGMIGLGSQIVSPECEPKTYVRYHLFQSEEIKRREDRLRTNVCVWCPDACFADLRMD
jgi:hypothetical protein